MGIFSKKPKYALSDILKGLHNAVNSAQEMLQAQQVQNLTKFWQANHSFPNKLEGDNAISHGDLQMEMEGIKATDNDVMEITIRFKQKDTPEGVARLTDEYNKQI